MDVRLLGPVEVSTEAGLIRIRSPKQRALLAMLALQPGRLVQVEALIAGLWGDHQPDDAEGSLRFHVARLRKLMAAQRSALATRPGGYELSVVDAAVDVTRFEQLMRDARWAGDRRAAVATLEQALALWRGPALADVADEPFAGPVAHRPGGVARHSRGGPAGGSAPSGGRRGRCPGRRPRR
jgi:DNA-binding SARP family transcriptional activator